MAWHDGPAGVGEQGRGGAGGPGTWESSLFPRQESRRDAGTPKSGPVRRTPEEAPEQTNGCCRGIAKRRQRSAARRATSSLSAPIVPRKRGNGGRTGPGGGKEGVKWQTRCGETRRMRWNLRTC